jgi:hypothetical protein
MVVANRGAETKPDDGERKLGPQRTPGPERQREAERQREQHFKNMHDYYMAHPKAAEEINPLAAALPAGRAQAVDPELDFDDADDAPFLAPARGAVSRSAVVPAVTLAHQEAERKVPPGELVANEVMRARLARERSALASLGAQRRARQSSEDPRGAPPKGRYAAHKRQVELRKTISKKQRLALSLAEDEALAAAAEAAEESDDAADERASERRGRFEHEQSEVCRAIWARANLASACAALALTVLAVVGLHALIRKIDGGPSAADLAEARAYLGNHTLASNGTYIPTPSPPP